MTESERAPIAAGSGTGAYQGIGGTFNLNIMISETFPKSTCDVTALPLVKAVFVTGSGVISF